MARIATSAENLTGEPYRDAANREVVAAVAADDLNLVGIAVRGPRNGVDRVVKGARMHP